MKEIEVLHRQAIELADQADLSKLRGDYQNYQETIRLAYKAERDAAILVAPKLAFEPTRSVLLRSAASFAIECGEIEDGKYLIRRALEGKPPSEISAELREMELELGSENLGSIQANSNKPVDTSAPINRLALQLEGDVQASKEQNQVLGNDRPAHVEPLEMTTPSTAEAVVPSIELYMERALSNLSTHDQRLINRYYFWADSSTVQHRGAATLGSTPEESRKLQIARTRFNKNLEDLLEEGLEKSSRENRKDKSHLRQALEYVRGRPESNRKPTSFHV